MRRLLVPILLCLTACGAGFTDISPNAPATVLSSSAGITYALAGNDAGLYAVSLSAGLWRSAYNGSGRTWRPLAGPRYAMSIAVDPADSKHLAVGEHNGDAAQVRLDEAGIWESSDGGQTFHYLFDPMSLADPRRSTRAPCPSQAVPSIVFTRKSTVVAATACGIVRRPKGAAGYAPATLPPGMTLITAVVASETKVWARNTAGALLVSVDDGATFALATQKPMPDGVSFSNDKGDYTSLAASDQIAVMSGCCVTGGPPAVNGKQANELIVYRVNGDAWSMVPIPLPGPHGAPTNSGTYLGGRRFVRSFPTRSGRGTDFYFSNGQAVWLVEVAGIPSVFQVAGSGVDIAVPSDPSYAGAIHNDFWDFAAADGVMWVASDGGVFENRGAGWKPAVDGLHTQHVQTLDVTLASSGTRVSYATQDNGGWWGTQNDWHLGMGGDVNWSDADAGNPTRALFGRSGSTFALRQLDGGTPPGASKASSPVLLPNGQPNSNPMFMQFIQSLQSENGVPLDAIMLVRRPVQPPNGVTLPASLSGLTDTGAPWLLRNKNWEAEADFFSALASWTVELNDLPAGTERVFASGGHAAPRYLALARDANGTWTLFQRVFVRRRSSWQPVFTGIIDWANGQRPSVGEGWYGPVHVNPYDPARVFLLAPDGVKVSHADATGRLVFTDDKVLTQLITASGTYPIVRETLGGNDVADPSTLFLAFPRMLSDSTLGLVSFFRGNPKLSVVAAPFTGAFFDSGDGIWRSFGNLVPGSYAPVWAARSDGQYAYLGFAGRSVGRVSSPGLANRATYFERASGFSAALGGGATVVAELHVADGTLAKNRAVSIRIVDADGNTVYDQPLVSLDSSARVLVPPQTAHAGVVIHLHFAGDSRADLAPSEFHFAY